MKIRGNMTCLVIDAAGASVCDTYIKINGTTAFVRSRHLK